jgi:hypothetical protein
MAMDLSPGGNGGEVSPSELSAGGYDGAIRDGDLDVECWAHGVKVGHSVVIVVDSDLDVADPGDPWHRAARPASWSNAAPVATAIMSGLSSNSDPDKTWYKVHFCTKLVMGGELPDNGSLGVLLEMDIGSTGTLVVEGARRIFSFSW